MAARFDARVSIQAHRECRSRRTHRRTTVDRSLSRWQTDVSADPAGVGTGGDVEVAGTVDRAAAGVRDRREQPGVGEAGGVGGVAGVGAEGVELGAVGVAGGDELIGTAIGKVIGPGLLADVFVGTGGWVEVEGLIACRRGAVGVGGDEAVVVDDVGYQIFEVDTDRLIGVGGADRAVGYRRDLPVGGRRAVFETIGGFEAVGIDLGI